MSGQKQHYVPEFLLKGFPALGTERLFCYDKWENRSFPTTPEKAAKENGFYDFEFEDVKGSFEDPLTNLEDKTAPVIRKLIESQKIADISDKERVILGLFCAVQMTRDKNSMANAIEFGTRLKDRLTAMGMRSDQIESLSDEKMRLSALMMIGKAPPRYLPFLLDKTWSLMAAPPEEPLYISDSPVTLMNRRTFGPYGNLGVAVPGIQISIPISGHLTLWLTCKTIETEYRETYQKAALAGVRAATPSMRKVRRLMDAFRGLGPFVMSTENAKWFNGLQVEKAERYIYSGKDDFSLARKMISDHPELKRGWRTTFS